MSVRVRLAVLVAILVALLGRADAAPIIGPIRVVLLVDSSSSVGSMLNPIRAGLLAFLDALPGTPETLDLELAFISSGGQLRVRVPPTSDRETLRKAFTSFAADGGGNAFVDALLEADQRFLRKTERKPIFVVLMNDNSAFRGEPRVDEYNALARDFPRRGGRAHGIVIRGMNSGVHTDIVMNLTDLTGGFYDAIAVPNTLPSQMKYMAAMVAADIP